LPTFINFINQEIETNNQTDQLSDPNKPCSEIDIPESDQGSEIDVPEPDQGSEIYVPEPDQGSEIYVPEPDQGSESEYVPEADDNSDSEKEYVSDSENSDDASDGTELPTFINFINQEIETNNQTDQLSDPNKPCQRKVKESEIVRDGKYNGIYIKKYIKSNEGKAGAKKDDRPYDTVHACLFCQGLYSHIQDHIERKHKDKEEVKDMMKLKKEMASTEDKGPFKKEIKRLQDCIR
jgi:hypothetical protein